MSHNLRRVPIWLLATGLVPAVAVHAMLLLPLGTRVTMAAALGSTVFVIVAKHLGLAAWSRRRTD